MVECSLVHRRTRRIVSANPREFPMAYLIKTELSDPRAATFQFTAQKTMYGGKLIAAGDEIFIVDSENEGGAGLVARGVVTSAKSTPRKPGIERQTPRVSIAVRRTALAR